MLRRAVYSDESGTLFHEHWFRGKRPESITVNGATLYYDIKHNCPSVSSGRPSGYPFDCFALGVHPDQRESAMKKCADDGVPTFFNKDGDPVIESRGHYNKFLKQQGFFNKDAGYGDVCPGQTDPAQRGEVSDAGSD